jgi:methylenetetrahydrofolate dehydrogenase (NADP+)/methenyltetrahydrofolate cyclohydrolase
MEEHLLHPSKRISQFAPQRLRPVELRQALAQFLLVMTQVRTHMSVENIATAKKLAGYIVQLPLPKAINTQVILEAIDPDKDADGLHPLNLGRLVAGYAAPLPCTPRAIVELINHYKIPLAGADVVVIGRGLTVGRPLGLLLTRKQENATVTLTHTGTKDLITHTKRADIVVAAIGQAHFLKAEMIKPGAVVLDVGISRTDAGLVGDVDPSVMNLASFVAPMPGGVGPMTRAMLLMNVVDACER